MAPRKAQHCMLLGVALLSLTAGFGLHRYAEGSWRNQTFESQEEASQAAKNWIKDGGIYTVRLRRSQLLEVPRDPSEVNDEINAMLEIEAGEREKCLKMLETIESADEHKACLDKFFTTKSTDAIPTTNVEKVNVIIKEERFRRDCRPLFTSTAGYVCGEHDIEEGAVINEREERNLRANLSLTYFYVEKQDA